MAWSASSGALGPSTAGERGSGAGGEQSSAADQPKWSPAGSLASDDEFVDAAVEELDVEERPVLLWAGEAQRGALELTEFAVFAVKVPSAGSADGLFSLRTVGQGDDGWEEVEGGPHQSVGSFANTIVVLPFDEIEGHDTPDSPHDILLTREDVTAVRALPGEEMTIERRTVATSFEDFEGSTAGRYAVSSSDGTGYTSPAVDAPLPPEDWDSAVAERVLGEISAKGGRLTTVGTPGSVTLDDGSATVAAVAEHQVGKVRDEEPDATTWSAIVDLPEEAVDSATSPTLLAPLESYSNGRGALGAGAPYAVPVDDKRLGGSALIVTPGVNVGFAVPTGTDEEYGDYTTQRYTATTEPELPALGSGSGRAGAQILEFDEPSAAIIWSGANGDPVLSTVVTQPSDS